MRLPKEQNSQESKRIGPIAQGTLEKPERVPKVQGES